MAAENVACGVRRHWEGSSQYRGLSRACTDAASAGIMNLSIKEDAVKVHRRLRRLTNDTDNRAAGFYGGYQQTTFADTDLPRPLYRHVNRFATAYGLRGGKGSRGLHSGGVLELCWNRPVC